MKAAKRKKKSIFLRFALAAFSIYVVVMLIQLQLEISDRQKKIADANSAIAQQTAQNDGLQRQIDNYELNIEKRARESGMARPGEKIYKETPG